MHVLLQQFNMKQILIIEDDDDTSLLLHKQLNQMGFAPDLIERCSTLAEVSNYKASNSLQIILTDLGLPDSHSSETFLRVQGMFPYTPIVVLTGLDELSTAMETLQQGAQDYLVKGQYNTGEFKRSINYATQRKKASNDSERLFNENPAPMYIYEEQTYRFLAVNNAALHQYGYTRNEFLKLSAVDIRPLEDVAKFKASDNNVPDKYYDHGQWRHTRKDGEVFYVHIYGHNTVFEGKAASIILALDVGRQVRAQRQLEEKTREIGNILESITDGFYTLNKDWEVTYFNKEAERILKQDRESVLHKNIWNHFPGSMEGKFYREYNRAMVEKVSVNFEEYYAYLDIWCSIRVYPTPDGIAVYFVDITQQTRIREKLFNDEQNLRAIINNTKDIIWSIDRNLDIISANNSFWERISLITGKPKEEVNGRDFQLVHYTAWKQFFDRAFAGESFKEIWTEERGNDISYEEISFNPIFDIDQNVIGASCFSRDVTQLREYIDRIESQNSRLKNIAWIQSHQVRSPVATILGLAELLNTKDLTDPANMELFKNIKEAAGSLDVVIKQITAHTED